MMLPLDAIGHPSSRALTPHVTSVQLPRDRFAAAAATLATERGLPLALLFATDDRARMGSFGLHAVFSADETHDWLVVTTALPEDDPRYESLTRTVMAAHWYERYAADMFGIIPDGHPDPRRLVHHENVPPGTHPLRKDFAWNTKMAHADVPYPMHRVRGEGVYEIPVGPIHAGIIEPGHFRFNVAGERIITLEGKLFFTHKGVEKLLEGKPPLAALPLVERVAGDAAASHALAFCQAVESLADCDVPARAALLRTAICELERITMHIHDISNIVGMGTGYTVVAANGFRVKERLMRLSQRLLGNRFWRGGIVPGGCSRDMDDGALADLLATVEDACAEMRSLTDMALRSDALLERLETTGILKREAALAYGAVGLPARASGIDRDARRDHPYAAYPDSPLAIVTQSDGDVYARLKMRIEEIPVSLAILRHAAARLRGGAGGAVKTDCRPKDGLALGAVESWRGEILTAVRLEDGVIDRCVIRDPSFCNWPLFGELGPGNIVPDFPLCNKSLNLSYSGTDL